MRFRRISLAPGLAAAAAGAALALPAAAQTDPQAQLRTRALAATCANCHGTDGRAVSESAVPGLAGMPASYLVEQMKAFRSGARPATVMHQLAKGYSDAQIEQIAAYFAARPH
ncbi:c-type cytochrome [Piscinibacter sakaiensis]|uniref:Cytochrome c subunit of flavocytochrome c sulfide dehydrogenase n=1 Tax=Piscinibacter sakaiensis TaxID=1547922 RepID=A0A0K8NYH5_PISS1|nr:c-type cytochrome [Piscinibacter sakaiensis]GAP35423.1 cytochrome c subunit of flavocytochrome c sulfide dehydrogenase [Piscinibacter sakaiensis]